MAEKSKAKAPQTGPVQRAVTPARKPPEPGRAPEDNAGAAQRVAKGATGPREQKAAHRALGNRGLGKAAQEPAPAQRAPLSVAQPDSASEQEAGEAASRVAKGGKAQPIKERPTAGAGRLASGAMPSAEQASVAHAAMGQSTGAAMAPPMRQKLESGLGADLGAARVHTGTRAATAAAALDARAVTVGNDIYLGDGESASDVALMAHEATHVVQNAGNGAAQRTIASREDGVAPAGGGAQAGALPAAGGGPAAPTLQINDLKIPAFKAEAGHGLVGQIPYRRARGYSRDDPGQQQVWLAQTNAAAGLPKLTAPPFSMANDHTYMLQPESRPALRLVGDPQTIAAGARIPFWRRDNLQFEPHQIDHVVELQISGWPAVERGGDIHNLEALNQSANQSSGAVIRNEVVQAVQRHLADATLAEQIPAENRTVDRVKAVYDLVFPSVDPSASAPPQGVSRYSIDDFNNGLHIDKLTESLEQHSSIKLYDLSNPTDQDHGVYTGHNFGNNKDVVGASDHFLVYKGSFGGSTLGFAWDINQPVQERPRRPSDPRLYGMDIQAIGFRPGAPGIQRGFIRGRVFSRQAGWVRSPESYEWQIRAVPGLEHAGYLDKNDFHQWIRNSLQFPGLSPITIETVDITEQGKLLARGAVVSDLPLIRGARIDIVLEGDELRLEKQFTADELHLPAPFELRSCTFALSIGTGGAGVDGEIAFGIRNVGEGVISGRGRSGLGDGGSLSLAGSFSFDSNLFDPARIELSYADGRFSGTGTLGIPAGKVRGIRSATANVSYAEGRLDATGTVQPEIPGVQSGTLTLSYSEAAGLVAEGRLALGEGIPRLRSGELVVGIEQRPEGGGYKMRGSGHASLDIPGLEGAQIDATYDDGAFDINGQVDYRVSILEGQIRVGVTNRSVDPATRTPSGPPGEQLTIYGGGTVSATFTPWLRATVGVDIEPSGELLVSGEVGIPQSVEVFPRREVSRTLFEPPPLDIPIFGASVAGYRVGVFATINGALLASAGFGPGTLEDTRANLTFRPSRPEEAELRGTARFVVPADAGLTLRVRAGIGAGLAVVSVEGGVQGAGELGVQGAAEASADLLWTPRDGIRLDANVGLHAEPKLRFTLSGYARASLSLVFTQIDLFDETYQLAGIELGSGLRFGVSLPITYVEGQPFTISLDQVQFEIPEIDPQAMIRTVMGQVLPV